MDNPLQTIQKVRGYEIQKSNIINITKTDLGTIVFYYRDIGVESTVFCFELLQETPNGYKWVTGGQHGDGRLDDGSEDISSVQHIEHLTENVLDGFIFGVMKSEADNIDVTKSIAASSWPYKPEIIHFGERRTLWYSVLPDDFGEYYDVIFSNEEKNIHFVESNRNYNGLVENVEFTYDIVNKFRIKYGYESGIIHTVNQDNAKILLYNGKKDILNALLITVDESNNIIDEQSISLPIELKGYNFYFKFGDYRNQDYLLAVRYMFDKENKKIYSDLAYIPKNDIRTMEIIQSYVQEEIAQGNIPTIIDFSVELFGNYIVYEDTDLFWKIQDLRTKKVYTSDVNEPSFKIIEPYYGEDISYIYILKYVNDGSILAFKKNEKEFTILKP